MGARDIKYEGLGMAVGSGAADIVVPTDRRSYRPAEPSQTSNMGLIYTVASWHTIPNLGQARVMGATEDGDHLSM